MRPSIIIFLIAALVAFAGIAWWLIGTDSSGFVSRIIASATDSKPTKPAVEAPYRGEIAAVSEDLDDGRVIRVLRDGVPVQGARISFSTALPHRKFFEPAGDAFRRSNHGPAAYWLPFGDLTGEPLGESDDAGEVRLTTLPGGIAITAYTRDEASATLVVERWGLVPAEVEFELREAATMSISVTEAESSRPLTADNQCFVVVPDVGDAACGPRYMRIHKGRESGFELKGLAAHHELTLLSTCQGYASARHRVKLVAGAGTHPIQLQPVACVSGRVTDHAGQPIAGAAVKGRPAGFLARPIHTTTDERGAYRLSLASGRMSISVRHHEFETLSRAGIEGGSAGVDFELKRAQGTRLSGRLLTADGLPVVAAVIDLWPTDRRGFDAQLDRLRQGRPTVTTRTSDRGTFEFRFVPQGSFALDAVLAQSDKNSQSNSNARPERVLRLRQKLIESISVTVDSAPKHLELRLPSTGRIEVAHSLAAVSDMLRGQPGSQVPFVLLKRVLRAERKLEPLTQMEIVPDTTSVFSDLPPGDYVVNTLPRSFTKHVVVRPGQSARVGGDKLSPRARGRVFRDGVALARCRLIAGSAEGELTLGRATSSVDGSFALTGVRGGSHVFRIRDEAGRIAFTRAHVASDREIRLDWPAGSLIVAIAPKHGRCRLEVVAESIAGLDIRGRLPVPLRTVATAAVAAGGQANFPGLENGSYELVLIAASGDIVAKQKVGLDGGEARAAF